jgi:hypothetical protein
VQPAPALTWQQLLQHSSVRPNCPSPQLHQPRLLLQQHPTLVVRLLTLLHQRRRQQLCDAAGAAAKHWCK